MSQEPEPAVYFNYRQFSFRGFNLVVKGQGDQAALGAALRSGGRLDLRQWLGLALALGGLGWLASPARAQTIHLPDASKARELPLPAPERQTIQSEVEVAYAKAAGKPAGGVGPSSPLTDGERGLTYFQRIQLVTSLERTFGLTIPDEHWQQMTTLGQLVDYVEKRKQIERALPPREKASARTWPEIQQSFPVDARPVYKK